MASGQSLWSLIHQFQGLTWETAKGILAHYLHKATPSTYGWLLSPFCLQRGFWRLQSYPWLLNNSTEFNGKAQDRTFRGSCDNVRASRMLICRHKRQQEEVTTEGLAMPGRLSSYQHSRWRMDALIPGISAQQWGRGEALPPMTLREEHASLLVALLHWLWHPRHPPSVAGITRAHL